MDKKQFRKDIEAKLDTTFGHLAKGGDKKFKKLVKKISHLLTDQLHKPEPKPAKAKKKETALPKTAPKKKAAKKVAKKPSAKKK